jgi:methyl-accepting chemotaxis protein
MKISSKILLLCSSIIVVFSLFASWLCWHFSSTLLEARRSEIRQVVETAGGTLDHFARLSETGQLTLEEAQTLAKNLVRHLRFGENNYLWITDLQPRMLMHPFSPELEGRDLTAIQDPQSVHMFVKMAETARTDGAGFVGYAWQKQGVEQPVDKIAFVKLLPRWNWVIGAGFYLDDLQHALSRLYYLTFGTLALVVILALAAALLIARGISRPLQESAEIMEKIGKGDFSLCLELEGKDEIGRVAVALNQCIRQVREMFLNIRTMGVKIAVNTLNLSHQMEISAQNATRQGEMTQDIFASSQQTTAAHAEIAANTQKICSSISINLENARASFGELQQTTRSMDSMTGKIAGYTATMGLLGSESSEIKKIVALIKSIATQTSLLSLNAAIEAARAGRAGKGFAVVADEVKALAGRVNSASNEIEEKIASMIGHLDTCIRETGEIDEAARATQTTVARSCQSFETMIADLEQNDGQLQGITAAVEELSAANDEVHGKVVQIKQMSGEVEELMLVANDSSQELMTITENLQIMNGRFKTGKGYGEQIVKETRKARRAMRQVMEGMLDRGINIFDRDYQPVPGTSPQKYRTVYCDAFARELQPLYDQLVSDLQGAVFALCVDTNSYGATHNSFLSRPLTGDAELDIAQSRDQRFFDDPGSMKAATNTHQVLMHTYKRDNGEILVEFALPIMIAGRHWGALRLGCQPEAVYDMEFTV